MTKFAERPQLTPATSTRASALATAGTPPRNAARFLWRVRRALFNAIIDYAPVPVARVLLVLFLRPLSRTPFDTESGSYDHVWY